MPKINDLIQFVSESPDNFDRVLRRFVKLSQIYIFPEIKKRAAFISPSEQRREARRRAIRRLRRRETTMEAVSKIKERRGR